MTNHQKRCSKKCDLQEAMLWNESAWTIGQTVHEIEPKARGNNLTLYKDRTNHYMIDIMPTTPKNDFAWSDQCINEHTGLAEFYRNPVVP